MTETIDQLILARFDAVASPLADADWSDVLARARGTEPRRAPIRIAVAAAVAILAATVTAVAFGWPGRVVDFFKAPPAPQSVRAFFGAHSLPVPGRLNPNTKLGEPREIMTSTFDADNLPPTQPTLHTLYVAPRDGGGFCYLWTDYGGGCADAENAEEGKTNPAARPLGVSWLANDYAGFVDGWVRPDVQAVEVRFGDGTSATIPVTRVTAPIDAGFFAYVVPAAHQNRTAAVMSVVALGENGDVVAEQPIGVTSRLDEDVPQTLPDGTKASLPRRAQVAHAREIASFRNVDGGRAYLWVMPRIGGGTCFIYGTGVGGGFGCTTPQWSARLPAVNSGGENGVYFAQVKPDVATVELHYRNGDSERFTPKDGFVFQQMKHDAGIAAVVGLDHGGRVIFTQRLPARPNPSRP
ncbi:MAG TPA: hypothetical protein VFU33_01355 [Gaiellaceae bacterium]|nr:hypothetical protein [Gaiellaceae bacterium]